MCISAQTFEFFDPSPEDFWSLEHFLRDFVDDTKDFPAQGLAQVISDQVTVGTMVKTGVDEYPIGFITALNMHWHRVRRRLADTTYRACPIFYLPF